MLYAPPIINGGGIKRHAIFFIFFLFDCFKLTVMGHLLDMATATDDLLLTCA